MIYQNKLHHFMIAKANRVYEYGGIATYYCPEDVEHIFKLSDKKAHEIWEQVKTNVRNSIEGLGSGTCIPCIQHYGDNCIACYYRVVHGCCAYELDSDYYINRQHLLISDRLLFSNQWYSETIENIDKMFMGVA